MIQHPSIGHPGISFADFASSANCLNPLLSLTLGTAMFCTVLVAKLSGGLLPIAFSALGFDPAYMSAPLITTIVDIGSIFLYLTLAGWIMKV